MNHATTQMKNIMNVVFHFLIFQATGNEELFIQHEKYPSSQPSVHSFCNRQLMSSQQNTTVSINMQECSQILTLHITHGSD